MAPTEIRDAVASTDTRDAVASTDTRDAVASTDTRDAVASTRGTRSRAGNAMGRTREAALTGAIAAVAKYGSRKATMGDIATMAGIAKATLYNHFRTRDDVYAAVVLAEIDTVARIAGSAESSGSFAAVLVAAATAVGENAAVRRVARDEPAVLAMLATPGDGPGWSAARAHIARALAAADCESTPAGVDLVLRYLATQLLAPSAADERVAGAQLISAAVSGRPQQVEASALVGTAGTSS